MPMSSGDYLMLKEKLDRIIYLMEVSIENRRGKR